MPNPLGLAGFGFVVAVVVVLLVLLLLLPLPVDGCSFLLFEPVLVLVVFLLSVSRVGVANDLLFAAAG